MVLGSKPTLDHAEGATVPRTRLLVPAMLAIVVLAAACGGGDEETTSGQDDQQAQESQDSQDPEATSEPPEDPVAALWAHCATYGALLEEIARAESAQQAVADAQAALEEAGAAYLAADAAGDDAGRFDAEQSRLDAVIALTDAEAELAAAVRGFESAGDAAVASAEALVADADADSDERSASQSALEAYAAVVDAARFAADGQTTVSLGTPAYDAAYESALAAALGAAPPGRVIAEARVVAAETAVRDAMVVLEEAPAAEAAARAASAAAEDEAAATRAEVEAAAYAEAEQAAAAALAEADRQAAVLEVVASISVAVGEADSHSADVAYQAAREPAYNAARDDITTHWEHEHQKAKPADWIAGLAARDAAHAAQAALVVRLDALAGRAGLEANLTAAHQAAMSAWIAAWALAEDADWINRLDMPGFVQRYLDEFDRAAELAFDRQPAYDDLAYRAAARLVRTAVADSVPSSESVAAAEQEDTHWAAGGTAHRAFVAARDKIAVARAPHRGKIHPGTDGIAWDAYHVALDLLESAARAEAADIRADATTSRLVIDIKSDPRVVQTRAAAERSVEAVVEAEAVASRAYEALREAEAELADARAALDATQPPYDRALRAAWKAITTQSGCG